MTETDKILKGKNLYDKLSKVQSHSKELLKDKKNEFQSYKYFTEYQALNLLKPLLEQQGLALIFSDLKESTDIPLELRLNRLEKVDKEWIVRYWKKAVLIDADKPEDKIEMEYWCMGINNHISKAKGSAETYGMKYFLQKLFLMPTADNEDPDKDYITNIPISEEDKKKADELLNKYGLGDNNTPTPEKKEVKCPTCKDINLVYKPDTQKYWCPTCKKEFATRRY